MNAIRSATADTLTRRDPSSLLRPASFNREARTVEIVLTTGAEVLRPGYRERLDTSGESVELPASLPLLDTHRQGSIRDILGRVTNLRREGGQIVGTAHIYDAATLDMVERGDLRGVSIGYRVASWAESIDPADRTKIRSARRWVLQEASFVAIPADSGATVRSDSMPPENENTTTNDNPATETRGQINAHIRSAARALGTEFIDSLIDDAPETRADANSRIVAEMVKRNPTIVTHRRAEVRGENRVELQGEAWACRALGLTPSDAAKPYMNTSFTDHARSLLAAQGITVNGSPQEIITRAIHTIPDFAAALQAGVHRVAASAYKPAETPLKALARPRTLPDFRAAQIIRVSESSPIQEITEAGEIKSVTAFEATEGYSLRTYAGLFSISYRGLINDDTGVIRPAEMLGRAAAEAEARQIVNLLTQASGAGPVMGDGKRLFHTDHGNRAATGSTLSVNSVSDARFSLRSQKGLDGKTPISATPKYLVVASDLETEAEKILTTLAASSVAEQNPFAGRLTLLVEPRLAAGTWYVFADPAVLPVLELAHLAGAAGPQIESREGWQVLAREYRVVLHTGVGATDWRGAYYNPGEGV
ncbi:phage major capsid protein [Roseomonas mucosa]